MISRVAEHCFWMSRYLERAENTARVLDVNRTLLLDFALPVEQQWKPVLTISGVYDMADEPDGEAVQQYMTWEAKNGSSIASSMWWARENARVIREVISADMWERVNFYHLWMNGGEARRWYDDNRSEFYAQVRRVNQMLHGIADATMLHGEAWEFFRLGKYLERACQTARILDVKYHILLPAVSMVGTPVDTAHWMAILMSCSGYEPFHKRTHPSADLGADVAEFLIFDRQFPRSVRRCLEECHLALRAITDTPQVTDAERQLLDLITRLDHRGIDAVIRDGLHETLTEVVDRTHDIGQAVHRCYFDPPITMPC